MRRRDPHRGLPLSFAFAHRHPPSAYCSTLSGDINMRGYDEQVKAPAGESRVALASI